MTARQPLLVQKHVLKTLLFLGAHLEAGRGPQERQVRLHLLRPSVELFCDRSQTSAGVGRQDTGRPTGAGEGEHEEGGERQDEVSFEVCCVSLGICGLWDTDVRALKDAVESARLHCVQKWWCLRLGRERRRKQRSNKMKYVRVWCELAFIPDLCTNHLRCICYILE
jgi:hypothetical protein